MTDHGIERYVVKLFETKLIEEKDSVANEVLGNVLAREFNLPVPEAAFIQFGPSFVATIGDSMLQALLGQRDSRLKFGCKLKDGYIRFNPGFFSAAETRKMIEIDSLYAFDNLIRNPDRNWLKPNLLVKSDEAILIDHELGFEITMDLAVELDTWQWKERYYKYHVFYNYLRGYSQYEKKQCFHEFDECLKVLNIRILDSYFEQLASLGYSIGNHEPLTAYLSQIKQKRTNFVNMLKGQIL
jgi:HipA-like protein